MEDNFKEFTPKSPRKIKQNVTKRRDSNAIGGYICESPSPRIFKMRGQRKQKEIIKEITQENFFGVSLGLQIAKA